MMVVGFFINIYTSTFVLVPTEPPTMKPIEGFDYLGVLYAPVFWVVGILGICLTIIGMILWKKRK